jgi:hypothetical protein
LARFRMAKTYLMSGMKKAVYSFRQIEITAE